MRPEKELNLIDIAKCVARMSHDPTTQVGGVLVKYDGAIVATGFNGFVSGANDNMLPTSRPEKYEYFQHCEMNLVAHCARHGISTLNSTLYITISPCKQCTRLLFQSGIHDIVFEKPYSDFDKVVALPDISVSYKQDTATNLYKLKLERVR